jgi:riboflavin biosynthesis pyrimidine reductase
MIVSQLFPAGSEAFEADTDNGRARLAELYTPPTSQWLRINLVTTVSGSTVGADGTSNSLTGGADRRILGVIRELADVVLVGAGSIRAEGYQVPRSSTLAIVTSTGDLTGHKIAPEDVGRVIVICPSSASSAVTASVGGVRILGLESDFVAVPAEAIVGVLRASGFESIVCEGGPSLAGQLAAVGLVDEVCVTTSPLLGGAPTSILGAEHVALWPAELTSMLADDSGYVYSRWAIRA